MNLPRSAWGSSSPPSSFSSKDYRLGFLSLSQWVKEEGYTVEFSNEIYQVDLNRKIITLDLEDFNTKKWSTLFIGLLHECGHILSWAEQPRSLLERSGYGSDGKSSVWRFSILYEEMKAWSLAEKVIWPAVFPGKAPTRAFLKDVVDSLQSYITEYF